MVSLASNRGYLIAVAVLVALAVPIAAAYYQGRQQEAEFFQSQTDFAARQVAQRLQAHLQARLAVIGLLAAESADRPMPWSEQSFSARAAPLLRTFPDLQAINWVDETERIRFINPVQGNEGALGKRPAEHPVARFAFARAQAQQTPAVTEPLQLFQGGVGFAVYFPVVRDGEVVGYVNAVFRLERVAAAVFDDFTKEYFNLALVANDVQVLIEGEEPSARDRYFAKASVDVLDARWQLRAGPAAHLLSMARSPVLPGWALGSLLLALSLAVLSYRYIASVDARAKQVKTLATLNQTLLEAAQVVTRLDEDEHACAEELTRICCRALNVARATLWRREADSDEAWMVAMFDAQADRHAVRRMLKLSDYPEYWDSLCRDDRVIVQDAARDPRTRALYDRYLTSHGRAALLDVAIRVQDEVVGLFSIHQLKDKRVWTAEDHIFVQAVADLVALTFERSSKREAETRMREQTERVARRGSALADIADLLSPDKPLKASAERINELASEKLSLTSCAVWLFDTDAELLDAYSRSDNQHRAGSRFARSPDSALEQRLMAHRCLVVPDLKTDPHYRDHYERHLARLGARTALQVAVRSHGVAIGLLSMTRGELDGPWTPEDEIFGGALADMLALHLEMVARRKAEASLQRQARSLKRQAEALAHIAEFSARGDPDDTETFKHLNEVAATALEVSSAAIWLQSGEQLFQLEDRYQTESGRHEQGGTISAASVPEYYQQVVNNRTVSIVDGAAQPSFQPVHAALFPDETKISVLAAAVRARGRPVGLVSLVSRGHLRHWTVEEELFVGALSDLVSLTLETSARMRAESTMHESQKRLSLLIRGTPLAAIDWDTSGKVIGWNPAAERLFGYTAQQAMGMPLRRLYRSGFAGQLNEGFRGLKESAGIVERAENLTAQGEIVLCDWRNTLLTDMEDTEIGVTSLVEDVTRRVQREAEISHLNDTLEQRVVERTRELAEANAQLMVLDRLKTEFLATMSHELRTPLNSVIGFSSVLISGMPGAVNEEQKRQLDMILQSAKHLLGLINDLLDVSRIEAGQMRTNPTEFDPREVVEQVAQTLSPMVRSRQIELRVSTLGVVPRVVADRTRFFQIVVNLANNAVKFTERGYVSLELRADDAGFWVAVQDTGPGISEENLGHLFQAFRQIDGSARRAFEGTGLGLYLCKKLSHLLSGKLTVESQVGVGSTFSVWLPLRPSVQSGSAQLSTSVS